MTKIDLSPQDKYDLDHRAIYRACLMHLGSINPCDQETHEEREQLKAVREGLIGLWEAINERLIRDHGNP